MSNIFGNLFTLTTFGESHGKAIGGIVDGMPAGIEIDMDFVQSELDRRRPGTNNIASQRKESDRVELLSGVFEGKSTGAPIGFIVHNTDQHPEDYDALRYLFRPSHADYTYYNKYGIRDHRGGGRASARITISRCVGGALAKLALRKHGISIDAYTSQIGDIALKPDYRLYDLTKKEESSVRCPDTEKSKAMEKLLTQLKKDGDTIGGIVTCVIKGCPAGIGEPEFDKLHATLGAAMLSINAAKGFDYGDGFNGIELKGSQQNDVFTIQDKSISTQTNHSGGIQGGISNGEDIYFRVAFKPIPTLMQLQQTIDTEGNVATFIPRGRHDTCVVPRAIPIVEAMAAMVMLDHYKMRG